MLDFSTAIMKIEALIVNVSQDRFMPAFMIIERYVQHIGSTTPNCFASNLLQRFLSDSKIYLIFHNSCLYCYLEHFVGWTKKTTISKANEGYGHTDLPTKARSIVVVAFHTSCFKIRFKLLNFHKTTIQNWKFIYRLSLVVLLKFPFINCYFNK